MARIRIVMPKDDEAGRKYLTSLGVSRKQLTEGQWQVVASVGYRRSKAKRNLAIVLLWLVVVSYWAYDSFGDFDGKVKRLVPANTELRPGKDPRPVGLLARRLFWDGAWVGAFAGLTLTVVLRMLGTAFRVDPDIRAVDQFIRHMKRADDNAQERRNSPMQTC